jgi:transposase
VDGASQGIEVPRGHLSELGIIAERGLLGLAELAAIVRDESDRRLPATARAALVVLVRQIGTAHYREACAATG